MWSRRFLVASLLVLAVGCSRPSAKDCEESSRKWFALIYWEKAEKEISEAPAEQRDALRKAKGEEHDRQFKGGIDLAIMQCRGARDHDFVKCMKDANTATAARRCRPVKED
jgi:hypothetical protein